MPDAFDTEKLLSCMEDLKSGLAVSIPNYDFKTHRNILPARKVHLTFLLFLKKDKLNLLNSCNSYQGFKFCGM